MELLFLILSFMIGITGGFMLCTILNNVLPRDKTPKVGTNKKQRNNKDRKHDYLSGRKKPGVYNDINYK